MWTSCNVTVIYVFNTVCGYRWILSKLFCTSFINLSTMNPLTPSRHRPCVWGTCWMFESTLRYNTRMNWNLCCVKGLAWRSCRSNSYQSAAGAARRPSGCLTDSILIPAPGKESILTEVSGFPSQLIQTQIHLSSLSSGPVCARAEFLMIISSLVGGKVSICAV